MCKDVSAIFTVDRVRLLAQRVSKHIGNGDNGPSLELLCNLFDVMFAASLLTEELQAIRFSVCFVSPEDVSINGYCDNDFTAWRPIVLDQEIECSAESIKKIALATGNNAGLLGVHEREGKLTVWGFIDQWTVTMAYIEFNDTKGAASRPGLFIASIDEPGVISVYDSHKMIAMLNKDRIQPKFVNKLFEARLSKHFSGLVDALVSQVEGAVHSEKKNLRIRAENLVFETLYRIILRMTRYRRGGAFAILGNPKEQSGAYSSAYGIFYNRLRTSMASVLLHEFVADDLQNEFVNPKSKSRDDILNMHQEHIATVLDLSLSQQELEGCIEFVAGLTKIDGAVIMDTKLNVLCFGADIKCKGRKCKVILERDDGISEPCDNIVFGHRHSSMMKLCSTSMDCVGFVVSQDGSVRFMYKDMPRRIRLEENIAINRVQIRKYITCKSGLQGYLP